jgi:hypothetical protein
MGDFQPVFGDIRSLVIARDVPKTVYPNLLLHGTI